LSEEKPEGKKESPSVASKKQKEVSNCLLLVGTSGSGKTSLFYSLYTGQFRYTVSSIEENLSGKDESIKLGEQIERKVQTVDVPGHFNFRERIQELLESSAAIILVVDSKDKSKLAEASEILYDIINNIGVLDAKTPILVACNK
jgi:GTPase SAR1 family protein